MIGLLTRNYFPSVHLFRVHVSDGLIQEADISPDKAAIVWMWDVSSLGLPRLSCWTSAVPVTSDRVKALRHRLIEDPECVWPADIETRV